MSRTAAGGKKGPKIRTIVILVIILIIAAVIVISVSGAAMMSGVSMVQTSTLERKNLENSFSVTGIVESTTFKQVSANLTYNVDTVNVEVGDRVQAGDVLATLNSDDLQDQIVEQQASLANSNVNTEYSVSDAEKKYIETRDQISDGSYPEIRSAKLSLDSAQQTLTSSIDTLERSQVSLERAKESLEDARKNVQKANDRYSEQEELLGADRQTRIDSAQESVDSAKYELDCALEDYNQAKKESDEEDYSDIKDLKEAFDDAKKEYDSRYSQSKNDELNKARQSYESAYSNYSYMEAYSASNPDLVDSSAVAEAKKTYEDALSYYNELAAKYDVETTEDTYEKAADAYNKAKADIDSAHESAVKNTQRAYERAKASYDTAVSNLEAVKEGKDVSLNTYADAIETAEQTEREAQKAVEDAEKSVEEARKNVDAAQKSVDDAREAYDLSVKTAQSSLSSLKASADREKVLSENDTGLISLEILKEKLDDCVITAPCDGTVTAVYANEGAAAAGVLFIIEDTDSLKMTANVKEYNISELYEGLDVTVNIPSLDKDFDGVVSKIAPAGLKGADGKSDGSASFDVEIIIHGTENSGVLIGMTSKCTAVTDSRENVLAIGYDALVEEADGSCYVYTADPIPNGKGTATARKIPVEIGFESDAEIEIISDELTEGMDIINNAGDITDGGIIMLENELGENIQAAQQ